MSRWISTGDGWSRREGRCELIVMQRPRGGWWCVVLHYERAGTTKFITHDAARTADAAKRAAEAVGGWEEMP